MGFGIEADHGVHTEAIDWLLEDVKIYAKNYVVNRLRKYWMYFDTGADHGVTIEAVVWLLEYVKTYAEVCDDPAEANKLWKVEDFLSMVMIATLRGYKGFYTDLARLCGHQITFPPAGLMV